MKKITNWFPGIIAAGILALTAVQCNKKTQIEITGELKRWHPVVLIFKGPATSEQSKDNPFLNYRLDVTFTRNNTTVVVPGYYAADGNAAETGKDAGNIWKVHFLPPDTGIWQYSVSFRKGKNVAVETSSSGKPCCFDGTTGSIRITETDKNPPDFRAAGKLQYAGQRYYRFSNGEYFLKAGAGSPENFLAYRDFDGTFSQGETDYTKTWEAHAIDWQTDDPSWQGGKGKGIIGAVNYLSSMGMNSVYLIALTLHGDGKDVWPFTAPDERYRFDCSKLDQWRIVFEHMNRKGIHIHFFLSETENEQLFEADEGLQGSNAFAMSRKLFYREMVARFADLPGITFNLGEEIAEDQKNETERGKALSTEQLRMFMHYIDSLDPWNTPIAMHTSADDQHREKLFSKFIGEPSLSCLSLQLESSLKGDDYVYNQTRYWIEKSASGNHPWVVSNDEQGHFSTGVRTDATDPRHDTIRRNVLWGNLMAGGAGVEYYFGYKTGCGDLDCQNWRTRENLWKQSKVALDIFRSLPYSTMRPANHLTRNKAWCLADNDLSTILVYGKNQTELRIAVPDSARYDYTFYNPITGLKIRGKENLNFMPGILLYVPKELRKMDFVCVLKKTSGIYVSSEK